MPTWEKHGGRVVKTRSPRAAKSLASMGLPTRLISAEVQRLRPPRLLEYKANKATAIQTGFRCVTTAFVINTEKPGQVRGLVAEALKNFIQRGWRFGFFCTPCRCATHSIVAATHEAGDYLLKWSASSDSHSDGYAFRVEVESYRIRRQTKARSAPN